MADERKERKVTPPEEKAKRGRWVLPVLLVLSVLIGLYFQYFG